jgi:hypothetical protein
MLYGKDEMFLVKMNFTAILTALNRSRMAPKKLLVRSHTNRSEQFFRITFLFHIPQCDRDRSDRAEHSDDRGHRREHRAAPRGVCRSGVYSPDRKSVVVFRMSEFDATNYFVVGRSAPSLKTGQFAELLFYKKSRTIDWSSPDLEKQFPPDAIFSFGKWLKGDIGSSK